MYRGWIYNRSSFHKLQMMHRHFVRVISTHCDVPGNVGKFNSYFLAMSLRKDGQIRCRESKKGNDLLSHEATSEPVHSPSVRVRLCSELGSRHRDERSCQEIIKSNQVGIDLLLSLTWGELAVGVSFDDVPSRGNIHRDDRFVGRLERGEDSREGCSRGRFV